MPFLTKDQLEIMYLSGQSMFDIAQHQKVSLHKVAYWMGKYGILTRSRSDATYIKRNPTGDPFLISVIDSERKAELKALGIALFLGEGTRKQKDSVRLSNSDPKIINLFILFLKEICGVKGAKIRAWINMFDDKLYEQSLNFWSTQIGISKTNFYAPIIRKRKIGTYKNKSRYGTITVCVSNKKLLNIIKKWCTEYIEKYIADVA